MINITFAGPTKLSSLRTRSWREDAIGLGSEVLGELVSAWLLRYIHSSAPCMELCNKLTVDLCITIVS